MKGSALDAKTLILGNSIEARGIAEALLERDGDVIVALPGPGIDAGLFDDLKAGSKAHRLEVLPVAGVVSCGGSVGRYRLTFGGDGNRPIDRTVSSIVIADDAVRRPNFSLYGVGPSEGVVSLSRFHEILKYETDHARQMLTGKRIVFLTGLADESNPVVAGDVMRTALEIQQAFDCQTYLFTGNLKVAGNGLEALYRRTKNAGIVYMKFTESMPDMRMAENGGVVITYRDEVIREPFELTADVTIIDEVLQPSTFSRDLAGMLEIDTGPDGFVQSDNVHRATVFTNRKGIFAAGFSRCVQTEGERRADVGSAALAVLGLYQKEPGMPAGKAEIEFAGYCVGCLTCFRSCPYGAISLEPRVVVDPQACEGCGICAAACPRFAIKINTPAGGAISDRIPEGKRTTGRGDFKPDITAFCCRRSAKGAGDLASCMGHGLPSGLHIVEMPCAGGLSREHLLAAFSKGADGVLVLTCHEGNCHSEYGNLYARQRVAQIAEGLPQLGFEPERLAFKTLAANMGREFADTLNAFENTLLGLGPSRLKQPSIGLEG